MRIGRRDIGAGHPVYIIAEASANHCHNYDMACMLVRAAAAAGADAVKFQTYEPGEIATETPVPRGVSAEHDAWLESLGNPGSLRELLAGGGLPREWHFPLRDLAHTLGIDFLSTPFSVDAANFLVNEVGVPAVKIASGDLTFKPLLEYVGACGVPIILSTGGAYLHEVYDVVTGDLSRAYNDGRLALLHCVSAYPTRVSDVNLLAIKTLMNQFQAPVGFSDHTTLLMFTATLAVMTGACILEKHFSLGIDGDAKSADARHSLTPRELMWMVQTVRHIPVALGDGRKVPREVELHDRLWARRSPDDWLRPTAEARQGRWR